VPKKKVVDIEFLKRAIQVLQTVFDEFDTSDAEYDEGLLKTAFTNLINEGFIKKDLRARDLGLHDLMEEIFGEQAPDDLLDRAQTFDNLVDTYVGEPSDEDIEEAQGHLERILKSLNKKAEALAKRKLREEGLWGNA
jgi:hypothetical protein